MIAAGDEEDTLRYAEYVLGVLDADARAAVAREIETTGEAATAIGLWQRRLLPLAESIEELAPAPYVWQRIRDALRLNMPSQDRPRKGLWNNLPLWHWLGIGAGLVAATLLVVLLLSQAPRPAGGIDYMASTIQQDNGVTGWTATMDLRQARMVVVPATPVAFAAGRAPELWLIPRGGKPIAVGMIARDKPTTLVLDSELVARLGPTAALAVSAEPIGGSPTGQPSGAVIAKGAIGGA